MAARKRKRQRKGGVRAVDFKGRLQPPWPGWEGIEISPEGIHTPRGTLRPDEIDLLFWKAAFFDRGNRIEEDIRQGFKK